ncbi:MAG: hypothetical protein KGH57_02600 [Candidatus Micrarchaeota archaeon]|nr:hypothetical protein [Candidatus Micrarchaeota archaeon]
MNRGGPSILEAQVFNPGKFATYLTEADFLNRLAASVASQLNLHVLEYTVLEGPETLFKLLREAGKQDTIERLRDYRERVSLKHIGEDSRTYTKAFLDDSVERAKKAVERVGRHGRVEIYTHIVGKLNTDSRQKYPGSSLFIDLVIKDMLLSERDMRVREEVWENAGLAESPVLQRQDMRMFSNAKRGKSI